MEKGFGPDSAFPYFYARTAGGLCADCCVEEKAFVLSKPAIPESDLRVRVVRSIRVACRHVVGLPAPLRGQSGGGTGAAGSRAANANLFEVVLSTGVFRGDRQQPLCSDRLRPPKCLPLPCNDNRLADATLARMVTQAVPEGFVRQCYEIVKYIYYIHKIFA